MIYSTRQKKMDGSNGTCKVSNGNVTLLLRYSKVTGKLLESYWKVTAKLLERYSSGTHDLRSAWVQRRFTNAAPLLRFGTSPTEPSLRAETLNPSLVPTRAIGGQHYRTSRRARRQVFSPRARAGRLRGAWPQSERRTQMINWEWLLLASALLLRSQRTAAACAAAPCTVMRNPQRSRPCAAKSPSVTSCGSTKKSALRKRLRVELAIAYVCYEVT